MAGEGTAILAFVLILLGFYFQQLWLSFIFVIVILALIATAPTKKSMRAVPKGPIVRPIIVKRRYVGPKLIYPEKMKIKISGKPDEWYEYAGAPLGTFLGNAFRVVRNMFVSEENRRDPNTKDEWVGKD